MTKGGSLLLQLLLIVGCSQNPPVSPSSSSLQPSSAPTRYAAQLRGFVGAYDAKAAGIQFVLADVRGLRPPTVNDFGDLNWVTDRGPIEAVIDGLDTTQAGSVSTSILRTHAANLPIGTYRVTGIEYVSAAGESEQLSTGDVLVDVRPHTTGADAIEFWRYSVGQTRMAFIEMEIGNVAASEITVRGLDFHLEGVTSRMYRATAPDASQEPGMPQPGPELTEVTEVELAPGDRVGLQFTLEMTSPAAEFTELAPFLVIEGDGRQSVRPVPLQTYFTVSGDEAPILDYVRTLPASASHELHQ